MTDVKKRLREQNVTAELRKHFDSIIEPGLASNDRREEKNDGDDSNDEDGDGEDSHDENESGGDGDLGARNSQRGKKAKTTGGALASDANTSSNNNTSNQADLIEKLNENDRLHRKAETANQLVIVNSAFGTIGEMAKNRAKKMDTAIQSMDIPTLVQKLNERYPRISLPPHLGSMSRGAQPLCIDLVAVGMDAGLCLAFAPGMDFMWGNADIQPKVRKRNLQAANEGNAEKRADKVVKHAELVKAGETERTETDKQIEKLNIKLKQQGKVSFTDLIIDPDSFGKSVENLFHASFLVKDNRARIVVDEDGVAEFQTKHPGHKDKQAADHPGVSADRREQAILRFDHQIWSAFQRQGSTPKK